MKKWAWVTVSLYLVALLAVTVPLWIAMFGWGDASLRDGLRGGLDVAAEWGFWIFIAAAALGQVMLLVVPVAMAERRPQSRRRLRVPVAAAALLLGLMTVSLVTCIAVAIAGDDGGRIFTPFGDTEGLAMTAAVGYVVVSWIAWALVFRRALRESDPETRMQRLVAWLLRGSILELLVAVPSHVIARQRHDCCAPAATAAGIVTGVTVMLMSFGPGVFFLFAARARRLQSRA